MVTTGGASESARGSINAAETDDPDEQLRGRARMLLWQWVAALGNDRARAAREWRAITNVLQPPAAPPMTQKEFVAHVHQAEEERRDKLQALQMYLALREALPTEAKDKIIGHTVDALAELQLHPIKVSERTLWRWIAEYDRVVSLTASFPQPVSVTRPTT
jgi:hypothetical protein